MSTTLAARSSLGLLLAALFLATPEPIRADDSRGGMWGQPAAKVMKVGEVHPDFTLPTVDGDWLRLSDYRGKKVLLIHFASW